MSRSALGLLLLLGLGGCPPPTPPCSPRETRCTGNVAQICRADQHWATIADCDQVSQQSGREFVCQAQAGSDGGLPSGSTCLPKAR
jgi:hypothetical protein